MAVSVNLVPVSKILSSVVVIPSSVDTLIAPFAGSVTVKVYRAIREASILVAVLPYIIRPFSLIAAIWSASVIMISWVVEDGVPL